MRTAAVKESQLKLKPSNLREVPKEPLFVHGWSTNQCSSCIQVTPARRRSWTTAEITAMDPNTVIERLKGEAQQAVAEGRFEECRETMKKIEGLEEAVASLESGLVEATQSFGKDCAVEVQIDGNFAVFYAVDMEDAREQQQGPGKIEGLVEDCQAVEDCAVDMEEAWEQQQGLGKERVRSMPSLRPLRPALPSSCRSDPFDSPSRPSPGRPTAGYDGCDDGCEEGIPVHEEASSLGKCSSLKNTFADLSALPERESGTPGVSARDQDGVVSQLCRTFSGQSLLPSLTRSVSARTDGWTGVDDPSRQSFPHGSTTTTTVCRGIGLSIGLRCLSCRQLIGCSEIC